MFLLRYAPSGKLDTHSGGTDFPPVMMLWGLVGKKTVEDNAAPTDIMSTIRPRAEERLLKRTLKKPDRRLRLKRSLLSLALCKDRTGYSYFILGSIMP
jgi:hypothetical protein